MISTVVSSVVYLGCIVAVQFGPGIGPIHLANVHCQSGEERLADCPASTASSDLSQCTHSDDVSVHCWARGGYYTACK